MRVFSLCVSVSMLPLLAACFATQPPAKVVNNAGHVYARDAHYKRGMEVPKYTNYQRAYQPPQIAEKYISERHQYSVPAEVDDVSVATIEPPQPVTSNDLVAPVTVQQKEIEMPSAVTRPQMQPVAAVAQPQQTASMLEVVPSLAPLEDLPSLGEGSQSVLIDAPITTKSAMESAQEIVHFIWPVEGRVISTFGPKKNGLVNDGINISAADSEPIWAAADGEVVYAGNELKGYGNMVIVRHAENWMTAYAHASEIRVTKGQRVEQGDVIGYVGSSGSVKEAQLHFGIRQGKTPVDPMTKLPQRFASK